MTDAEKVLRWLGMRVAVIDGELRWDYPGCDHSLEQEYYSEDVLDANWIHGTLIPALRDRLLFGYVQYWTVEDDDHCVALESGEHGTVDGTGPTFEAAFLAAAAKAVSDE